MPVHMPTRRKHHLNGRDEENRQQAYRAGHSLVVLGPEIRQAGVAERREGRRQQVHEGRREQHARAEVAGAEEEGGEAPTATGGPRCSSGSSGSGGRRARGGLAVQGEGEEWEGAGEGGDEQDDEEGCDVEGRVVGGGGAAVGPGAGGWHGWLVGDGGGDDWGRVRFRFGGVYSGFLALCGRGVEGDFLFAAMGLW